MMYKLLVGAIMLAGLVALVSAESSKVLDNNSIDFVAEVVCDPEPDSKWQITKIETIEMLILYLAGLPEEHKHFSCSSSHLSILKKVNEIIYTDRDDACSKNHIDLIESFHRKFISNFSKDKEDRLLCERNSPKLVVQFFMHYVYQVADACKLKLIERLNSAGARDSDLMAAKKEELQHLDYITKELFNKNGSGSYKQIKGITLVWSLVEKTVGPIDHGYYSAPTASNGYKRATASTANADKVLRCQRECNNELKPIYASTLLPVIRLIDLGYYMDDEPFAKEIAMRPTLRRLIGVTLICEFVLPLRVVQDDSLKVGTMKMMSKAEAETAAAETGVISGPDQHYQSIYRVSLAHLQRLPTATDKGSKFVKALKANIRSHEKVFARVMNVYFEKIKDTIKSWIGVKKTRDDLYPKKALPLFELLI